MTNQNGQQPLILLISKEEREEGNFKQWMEANESSVYEANDIFHIIEEIHDFTTRECPDVFLLEVEQNAQHSVEEIFYVSSGASEVQVVAYSKTFGENRVSALSIAA